MKARGHVRRVPGQIANWAWKDWRDCLMEENRHVSLRVLPGFQRTQSDTYEVALQGHSGRQRVDPTLQNHVLVPYTWTDYTFYAGSPWDYRSIIAAGLLAGRTGSQEGRQTCFFTTVSLLENTAVDFPSEEGGKPRILQYKSK